MGDPKKNRKKYSTPKHPWQKERIEEENVFVKEYGLKNKKEIWRHNSKLKDFSRQTKRLIALKSAQSEKEKAQLLAKLDKLGLIEKNAKLEDIFGIDIKNIFERRLQSLVFRKGLARTMKQARQFITHEHITVDGNLITSPSYLVPKDTENTISFVKRSVLSNPEHPERAVKEKAKDKKPQTKNEPNKKEESLLKEKETNKTETNKSENSEAKPDLKHKPEEIKAKEIKAKSGEIKQ